MLSVIRLEQKLTWKVSQLKEIVDFWHTIELFSDCGGNLIEYWVTVLGYTPLTLRDFVQKSTSGTDT